MGNGVLAQFPAQQEDLALDLAGKIEQSDVKIFHLHAGGVDFGEGVFDAANRPLALGLAARQMDHIQHHAAVEKNTVRRLLQLGVHVFNQLLAVDCLPEQRLQNRQEHLRFIEGKGALGHVFLFYNLGEVSGFQGFKFMFGHFRDEQTLGASAAGLQREGVETEGQYRDEEEHVASGFHIAWEEVEERNGYG